jgi:mRNA interferase MazF
VNRGDIVIVVAQGDYGKPRPAVVIQSDRVPTTGSVLVALMTSELADAPIYRLTLEPTPTNGLKVTSQIMVDKIVAMPRPKCGPAIGRIDEAGLIALNHMLSVVIGLAD